MNISRPIATVAATLVIAMWHAATAQGQGVGRFPEVAQVKTDYPDEAERFIAFDILFNQLNDAKQANKARSNYALASGYLSARNEVLAKYQQLGNGSEAYKTFTARSDALFSDPRFRQSVLERYGLRDTSSAPVTPESLGSTLFPERPGDRSDDEIKAAFYEALPIWGAAVLAMIGLTWILMRSAGDVTVKASSRTIAGLPQLPESLRTVSVSGRRYDVVMASGLVLGTSVNGAQQDLVSVRTTDRRQMSWTFPNGVFDAHDGHVVSLIERPLPDGGSDVLVAYNHTTDRLEIFPGLYAAHATRFLFPFLVVAAAGSIPGAFGLGLLFHRLGGLSASLPIALATLWIMGAFASTIIAAFIAVRMKVKVEARRTAMFLRDYVPKFRRFLSESTAALTNHFAKPDEPMQPVLSI